MRTRHSHSHRSFSHHLFTVSKPKKNPFWVEFMAVDFSLLLFDSSWDYTHMHTTHTSDSIIKRVECYETRDQLQSWSFPRDMWYKKKHANIISAISHLFFWSSFFFFKLFFFILAGVSCCSLHTKLISFLYLFNTIASSLKPTQTHTHIYIYPSYICVPLLCMR